MSEKEGLERETTFVVNGRSQVGGHKTDVWQQNYIHTVLLSQNKLTSRFKKKLLVQYFKVN